MSDIVRVIGMEEKLIEYEFEKPVALEKLGRRIKMWDELTSAEMFSDVVSIELYANGEYISRIYDGWVHEARKVQLVFWKHGDIEGYTTRVHVSI